MKKGYKSKGIRGKYRVYKYLAKIKSIRPHLPHTKTFSEDHLKRMLKKFAMVYIKPDTGAQGFGIYKVEKSGIRYIVKTNKGTLACKNPSEVYQYIKNRNKKKLIVQKGIRIDTARGRPYDIRAMVQRKPRSTWKVTGIFAKIGQPKRIVTNYHQGGELVTMRKLFRLIGLSSSLQTRKKRHLTSLSLRSAKVLSARQSGMHEMGVDLAYDNKGNLYILEVNSRMPGIYPLKSVSPVMYRRMMSFAASYGRNHG